MNKKEKVLEIQKVFDIIYKDAKCSLDFENPLQLLIATQLAAQCTDKRVNQVTPALFERFKTAEDFANADILELEEYIRSTGFYHNKLLQKDYFRFWRRGSADHGGTDFA